MVPLRHELDDGIACRRHEDGPDHPAQEGTGTKIADFGGAVVPGWAGEDA